MFQIFCFSMFYSVNLTSVLTAFTWNQWYSIRKPFKNFYIDQKKKTTDRMESKPEIQM